MQNLPSIHFIMIFLILCLFANNGLSQDFKEEDKRCIYEIETPAGKLGTCFAITEKSLGKFGNFIVTCRHVIKDSNGNYVDSIYLRKNKLLSSGQVVSNTSKFVIKLKMREVPLYIEHKNPDIDLIMILLLPGINISINPNEYYFRFNSSYLLSKDEIGSMNINEGIDVEIIGFSLSKSLLYNGNHYHYSRFGKIGLYTTDIFTLKIDNILRTANFILLDMPIRGGDSGSPIIAHINGKLHLLGFVSGYSPLIEYGIGFPSYYILDLLENMRLVLDKLRPSQND